MIINSKTQKSSVFESLTPMQQAELITFVNGMIQGALAYKNQFTTVSLIGGKNRNWNNTPLDYIYQYHVNKNSKDPEIEAGKDAGRILKYIMDIDKHRIYKISGTEQKRFPVNVYEQIGTK